MKRAAFLLIIFTSICTCIFQVHAQTVEELRKQRKEIQDRINATDKQLRKTIKSEKDSQQKLSILKSNMNDRRKLINTFNSEINALNTEINRLTKEQTILEKQLQDTKTEYALLIRNTQMNRNSYTKLMFLLSAKNFDQSIRRARYLQEFADYKKTQVRHIESIKKQIELKADSLNQHKNDKEKILKIKETENAQLKKEEEEEKTLLAGLKEQEKKLTKEFSEHQRKRDQIDNRIQQVIAEEIRKAEAKRKAEEARIKAAEDARKKAAEEARKKADQRKTTTTEGSQTQTGTKTKDQKTTTVTPPRTTESVSAVTREEKLLSGGFANNRGRLPWPVERGVISGKFGTQPHPELKHVTINNKGTYFRSPSGTNARAVYEGVVTRRFALPGSGSAVIIQHGSYRTVYGNLSKVYVNEGDRVSAKQAIGQIFTDGTSGQSELQFQIWSGSTMLNPEVWISR